MARLVRLVAAAVKFVGALALGLCFVTIIHVVMLLTAPSLAMPLLLVELVLVVVLSVRLAMGKRTRVDRAAGAAGAGAAAVVVYSVGMVAAAVFGFGILAFALLAMGGAGAPFVYFFGPIAIKAVVVYSVARMATVGLIYMAQRIWKP